MALEDLGDNLRYVHVLENACVVAELQVMQRRHQGQLIVRQALARFAHRHIVDEPVKPFTAQAQAQEGWLVEQTFQFDVGVLADQFNAQRVEGADGFAALERQYLEVVAHRGDE
ncbi:hypothetical protein D3C77_606810 [compost metagenome]